MRAAIIGVGTISHLHIAAIKRSGQDVVALCDKDLTRCSSANVRYGLNASLYEDYTEMVCQVKPDVVHICTPHYLHAQMISYCLDRDVNVLCEKPMAIDEGQLSQIERSVERSHALLGVCQQNRYNASIRYAKQYFADKRITAATGTLCWQRNSDYYNSGAWRGKKLYEGGGVVINQALHTLDLLQWFCGMPCSVVGHTVNDKLHNVIEVEESAFGVFDLDNGSRFILNATNAGNYSFPVSLMLKSEKDEMLILGDNIILNGTFLTRSDGLPMFAKEEWGVGHYKLIEDFYNCVACGRHFPIDFYEAQKVVRLTLALYESKGETVKIRADGACTNN